MKKIFVPDVNVWVALVLDSHEHHAAALAWLRSSGDSSVGFCRVTQHGLLRLLTNRRVMQEFVLTLDEAWECYDRIARDRKAAFLIEPAGVEATWRMFTHGQRVSTNVWTDAYLAAFALAGDYEIVTLDRGFAQFNLPHCTILA
jgi:uncharacterized protein